MSALAARIARAHQVLAADTALLLDVPHPDRGRASRGFKMRGHVTWMLEHAGAAGKTRACKIIEKALEPTFKLKEACQP